MRKVVKHGEFPGYALPVGKGKSHIDKLLNTYFETKIQGFDAGESLIDQMACSREKQLGVAVSQKMVENVKSVDAIASYYKELVELNTGVRSIGDVSQSPEKMVKVLYGVRSGTVPSVLARIVEGKGESMTSRRVPGHFQPVRPWSRPAKENEGRE